MHGSTIKIHLNVVFLLVLVLYSLINTRNMNHINLIIRVIISKIKMFGSNGIHVQEVRTWF